MRLNPAKSISGRILLTSLIMLMISFVFLYYLVLEALKKEEKSSFFTKMQVESKLLMNTTTVSLNALDYVSFFNIVNSFVKEDPDIYEVTLYEFSKSSPLIKLKSSKEILPECNRNIFQMPCFVRLQRQVLVSGIPVNFEVKYSTGRIISQVEKLSSLLLTVFSVLFLIISVILGLNFLNLKSRVEFIVDTIKNWQKGLIAFEQDRERDEFSDIEKSVLDMYFEILKEKKVDELLLSVTSKIVSLLPETSNPIAFLKKLASILKEELKLNYVKIVKDEGEVKPKPGQRVMNFKNNPEFKLIFEGNFPFQEEVLNIFENFIGGTILAVKEKARSESLLIASITALANAIDAMSPWTRGHSERVSKIAVEIGETLGLDEHELKTLKIGGLLHDIGKLGIPQSVLNKPAKLDSEEYEVVKKHSEIGFRILEPVKELKSILPIVLYHHERCNGKGYPRGLTCEEIPLLAKIVAVADVIEAMTAERPYKKAHSLEEVFSYLRENAGKDKEFDPEVVEAAINSYHNIEKIISEPRP